jgi:CMP-N,N'-diacetyllegionaminic acid synthase
MSVNDRTESFDILGVVPARAGSRGVPGKNTRSLAGRPLIAYSIAAGLDSRLIDRLVVSTDSEEIAALAREQGAGVPFLRPPELSGDDTPMMPVLRHALEKLEEEGSIFGAVVCLQPTSPLRSGKHVDDAIRLFLDRGCSCLVSVCRVAESPYWMLDIEDGIGRPFIEGGWKHTSRQSLPRLHRLNGAIQVLDKEVVEKCLTLPEDPCVYEMPERYSVDIDTELDWKVAEAFLMEEQ